MAFNLAAAAGGPTELLDAFLPGAPGPIAGRSQFPQLAARNDSSVPTVNLFIDGASPAMKYDASIVDVCGDRTTYAIHCSTGPSYLQASGVCGARAPVRSAPLFILLCPSASCYVCRYRQANICPDPHHHRGLDLIPRLGHHGQQDGRLRRLGHYPGDVRAAGDHGGRVHRDRGRHGRRGLDVCLGLGHALGDRLLPLRRRHHRWC